MSDIEQFEPKLSWNSSNDDLVKDFYRPVLKNATLYQRKAGYFSSTSFIKIIKEIIELIENGGRIQLITSPNFSSHDKDIIEKSIKEKEQIISDSFFSDILDDPKKIKQNFTKLLAYMLVHKIHGKPQLEIKIAMVEDGNGIFHEKLGIIHYFKNDIISFSGSVNETNAGWSSNIENFKAFCNWKDKTNKQAIEDDVKSFNNLWNNNMPNVKIFDIPNAVKNHLLNIRPKSDAEYKEILEKIYEHIDYKKEIIPNSDIILRSYQIEAQSRWIDNNYKGIFSMATGTGKTITALCCINKFQQSKKRTITIIACSQTHLVNQWKEEITKYNLHVSKEMRINIERHVICYAENSTWRKEFKYMMNDFNDKLFDGSYIVQHVIVYVTHKTLNTNDFKQLILEIQDANKFLVVDEVHNVGSMAMQLALLEQYDGRLGLSATPIRHYDPEGTNFIREYFDKVVYELSLKDAIEVGYLCGYEYHPYYAELTDDEMDMYYELSKKIAAKYSMRQLDSDEKRESHSAEIKRADLIANAINKLTVLEGIINSIFNIKQTLIYCTSNPSPNLSTLASTQLDNVKKILSNNQKVSKSITFNDPTSDRKLILDKLAQGHYDCITAVKCLDEGVDIPSVETAIIMASSGNPRQYIQRRGRVLRQSKKTGKTKAIIYDILVKPPIPKPDSTILLRERKLVAKELLRHKEFAMIALNKNFAIDKIKNITKKYSIDFESLSYEYVENMG